MFYADLHRVMPFVISNLFKHFDNGCLLVALEDHPRVTTMLSADKHASGLVFVVNALLGHFDAHGVLADGVGHDTNILGHHGACQIA